jgi:hypothetical protein
MILTKTCSRASGDYNDLVTAIGDMIASGVAAAGDITNYILSVDNDNYSGQFDAVVPYSGNFAIIGNNTTFTPTGSCTLGGSFIGTPNWELKNFYIEGSGISDYFINIPSGCYFNGDNIEFVDLYNGFNSSGLLDLSRVNSCGRGSGIFINSNSNLSLTDSNISDYTYAVKSAAGSVSIDNNALYGNTYDVYATDTSYLGVSKSLLYGSSNIYISNSVLSIVNSTLVSTTPISGLSSSINISHSILSSTGTYTISGTTLSGYIDYTNNYSGTWESVNISGSNNYNQDPVFVDAANNDYRLLVNSEYGSFAINAGERILNDQIDIEIDTNKFMIYDGRGSRIPHIQAREFLYKQDQTIVFTDYGREVRMAELLNYYNSNLTYQQTLNILTTFNDVLVTKSFNDAGDSIYPFEWDYNTLPTTKITNENTHVIPRSVVDISSLILPLIIGFGFNFSALNKNNITVNNKVDYRGISYDVDLLVPGESTLWAIEGRNQKLLKKDAYTGESIFEYPLLTPTAVDFIKPSGIVYLGPTKDNKWKYINPLNPNYEYLAESKDGTFSWINPSLDTNIDLRGILAYKENLYITGTQYNTSLNSRDSIDVNNSGVGLILLYNNNLNYDYYMSSLNTEKSPTLLFLSTQNMYPTDITVYEDGTIYVADYNSGLHIYDLAYDYGLLENQYDKEVMILLKEEYNNVEI